LSLALAGSLAAEVKTTDPVTVKVREIGKELKCQCGCAYTVADCNMLYCHFRDPVNTDIAELVKAGLPTPDILSKIYAKYGEMLRTEPVAIGFGAVGWAMPFVALALGLIAAPFVVKRLKAKQPLAAAGAKRVKLDEEAVRRYEAQIEEDLARDD
jgi:cytochrome c-type biogenesis protein CcmH/NrfF